MSDYILASASPRRRELFALISKNFEVIPSNVPETVPPEIETMDIAEYLARLKASDIAKKYPDFTVIGADTCVIVDDTVLGKPETKEEAEKMLRLLSGRTHSVVTGCAICKNGKVKSFSSVTKVEFYDLSDEEINDYINTNEPYDKAGGYGIQGNAGLFVKAIKGDYFNVVGLPVAKLNRILKK